MTHARLDDQFDDEPYGLLDALSARYGHLLSKPSNIAWTVGAVVTVGFVFSNALFFQSGKHPAAIFETRVVSQNSALQVDELDLPVASSEPDKEVTRIVYDTDTETRTQSLPKPLPAQNASVFLVSLIITFSLWAAYAASLIFLTLQSTRQCRH